MHGVPQQGILSGVESIECIISLKVSEQAEESFLESMETELYWAPTHLLFDYRGA